MPDGYNKMPLSIQTYVYINFCSYVMGYKFLISFYPWPYTLNAQTSSCNNVDIFSIAINAFRKLF